MVLLFFFASGLSALVYQVAWTRAAGLALGNTTAAAGTVVAVFMAGLAAGSAWAGRAAARFRPLRLYGQIEIAIGLIGLALPFLFRATAPLHAWAYDTPLFPVARVLACGTLLLPPTFLMGATLPLLVHYARRPDAAGRLYAVNSAGAALGALAAGFLLIPSLGLAKTTALAAFLNLAVGVASIRKEKKQPAAETPDLPAPPLTRPQILAAAVYAASGFAALLYEMAWTRALTLAVGSTVYAFTLILFAFIAGLAIGSALAAPRVSRLENPLAAAAVLQVLIAAWSALLVHLLGNLPLFIVDLLAPFEKNFLGMQLVELGVVSVLILPPTILMGALLPVTLAAFGPFDPAGSTPLTTSQGGGEGAHAARSVGRVYAWNTLAAIAGSLAAAFLLLPALGIDLTLRLGTAVNVAAAAAALAGSRRPRLLWGVAGLALVAALFAIPRWEATVTASGPYVYLRQFSRSLAEGEGDRRQVVRAPDLEASYWDSYGLVTVHRSPDGELEMRVNGKTDASTHPGDMPAQALISQIPLILHPDPREVLIIGLGSGITVGSAQSHPTGSIECVELSPAVVRAARHFSAANGGALDRPGTRVLVSDGRAHVRYTPKSYDVIVSEPSNLWVSGMANLFTAEFFHEVRRKLRPGGLFGQWMQSYRLDPSDFLGVLRTFTEVFPHTTLWEVNPSGDYLLLASAEPRTFSLARVEEKVRAPAVARWLRASGIPDADHFLACYVLGPREAGVLARGSRRVTDDDCWIEYTAPFSMLSVTASRLHELLEPHRRTAADVLEPGALAEERRLGLRRFVESRRHLGRALPGQGGSDPLLFRKSMDLAAEANPKDALVAEWTEREARQAYDAARRLQERGRLQAALRRLAGIPVRSALRADALSLMGWILARTGESADAKSVFRNALTVNPGHVEARLGLAGLAEGEGRLEEARALIEEAVLKDPASAGPRIVLARFHWRRSDKARAREEAERLRREFPGDPRVQKLLEDVRD